MSDTKEREQMNADKIRGEFEAWYATHAFDYAANPIGSRECGLQWKAWCASREQQAKELAECQARVVELKRLITQAQPFLHGLSPTLTAICFSLGQQLEAHNLANAIDKALAATDTAAQTLRERWIPVSERLPEPDTYVLYYNGKYTGFGKWVSGEWCESDERWQTDFGEYIELLGPKITHWQPLPESPEEKP